MAQWGKNDAASNSVLWGVSGFNKTANSQNRDAFYDNVSRGAYITNLIAGQFGVDPTEIAVGNGNVVHITVTSNGSGYTANNTLTFSGGGGSSASANGIANNTGKISSVIIVNGGSSYETNPTVTVPAPNANSFNANTAVTSGTAGTEGANNIIALSTATFFVAGDPVNYAVAASNTALAGLTSGTKYYIQFANVTHVALAATAGGSRINLTKGFTETGHTLQGDTATAVAVVGGAKNKGVAHAGWNVRRVGTGGRAGRVQYETLVAMGSIPNDGNDDSILPDADT
jgi:hypothetical protein